MEDPPLFYEDRKGRVNSKKRKFTQKSYETPQSVKAENTDDPQVKRFKSFHSTAVRADIQKRNVQNASNYYKIEPVDSSPNNRNSNYTERKDSYTSKKSFQHPQRYDKKENADASEEAEKNKDFEMAKYYEQIMRDILKDELLKKGQTKASVAYISNLLEECKGYEVKLSCHQISSHCIELLLTKNEDPILSRQFMTAFALEKEEVCTNPNASHITELLLRVAVQNIQNWTTALELDDSMEKESTSYFISWISDFGKFVVENLTSCLGNQYASHVLCSVIRALGGDMSTTTDSMSKNTINHKKDFQNQYVGKAAFETQQHLAPVVLESVPKFFTKILKKMSKSLLQIEDIIDFVTESSSATVIEIFLRILKKRIPKRCKKLISGLATKIFSERNDDNVPKACLHRNCSFVVEKMFAAADEELQLSLWNEYFVDFLASLVSHSVGNYVIQRLFDVVESENQFEVMSKSIGSVFGKILSSRHYGIFLSVAGACNRLKSQQSQFIKNIMQCVQCAEPEGKPLQLVPRLLNFQTCDEPKISICLQGSLLVQAILKFHKPIKVVNSILNMKPKDLAYLAYHTQGCHVLNVFFSSNTVGEKSKDKFIQSIKPCITDIACDRSGGLTLSRIWVLLSMKQKTEMIKILIQNEGILWCDSNGSVLLKKFNVYLYKKNIDEWRKKQNDISQPYSNKKI